uniref:flagellar hook-length control protein FliK n=2 Tax=Aliarcobacter sp. TaxID=2321116 RepID=UPI0040473978
MPSSIDILVKEAPKSTSNTSSINDNQVPKDKPSLFDSLLQKNSVSSESLDNKTDETKTNSTIANTTEVKDNEEIVKSVNSLVTEDSDKIGKDSIVKVEESESVNKNVDGEEKKEVKTNSPSSLLDRMIIEAKKDVKVISEEEAKNLALKKEIETSGTIIANTTEVKDNEEIVKSVNSLVTEDSELIGKNLNINIDTNLENIKGPTEERKSLMDQLIQKNSEKNISLSTTVEAADVQLKDNMSKDILSNIYLSSQKNSMNNHSLFNKNEAINIVKDGTSIADVKTSANMLDLGLENIDIEQNIEIQKLDTTKKIDIDLLSRKNLLDNLLIEKNVRNEDIKGLITKSIDASSALLENSLTLADDGIVNVNSPLSYNIQSKIIGAKQQMSTMMSDIARQMYENYKPPVTVFKINLNPLDLGSIAILMKSDKNNALSISMNVSNNVTLDALIDNQNILRNSLNKTFDENTRFNLDFSSSNQNNNQSSNQNSGQSNQNNRFEGQIDTQSLLQLKEENKDIEEKIIDYM